MERVIAYVDGFNLYYGLKERKWQRYYWLDISLLAKNLLQPNQELLTTKYFTTRVSSSTSDPRKVKRQGTFLEALETVATDLSIYYGHFLLQTVECRRCGARWQHHSEKMTDVNIATELMTDAFQDAFDMALLVSGDSDLTPPVAMVHRLFPAKRVVVAFPPSRHSATLAKAASSSLHIGRGTIAASQMPDKVTKADGFELQCPLEWN